MPSGLNPGVRQAPGKPGVHGLAGLNCALGGTRGEPKFMMKYQEVVMEATTRIELVYTVLQTVA